MIKGFFLVIGLTIATVLIAYHWAGFTEQPEPRATRYIHVVREGNYECVYSTYGYRRVGSCYKVETK